MNTFSLQPTPTRRASGALYRAVWRWHFYAGVLAIPVALWLAVTGALYLWRPQYEAWRYRELLNVPAGARTVSADDQLKAAVHSQPWWATPLSFTPSAGPGRTSETVMRMERGARLSVFVNPHTGAVVGTRWEADRVMDRVRLLHGEMLAGRGGQIVVELVASWLALLLLTGFYLWWPRPHFRVWGFLLPRLRTKGRVFWRDLHAVPAVWLAGGALFQLATSVPGSRVAGAWWRAMAEVAGAGPAVPVAAGPLHSELDGWTPPRIAKSPLDGMTGASPGIGARGLGGAPVVLPVGVVAPTPLSLDRIIEIARRRHVGTPYAIGLPADPTDVVRLLSAREVLRDYTYLQLDQYSGRVLAETNERKLGAWGRAARWSEVAHEGWLAGPWTQILGTLSCAGVFLMGASGAVLWWQQRPRAEWHAPASLPRRVLAGAVVLGVALPLLGASVGLMLLVDGALGWRMPAARWRTEPALR